MWLTIRTADGSNRTVPVVGQRFTIGRDPGSDLVLDDPEVSRNHAVVESRDGQIVVRDLGSSNGTFVNGERLRGEAALTGGEKIRVGDTELVASAQPETVVPAAGAAERTPGRTTVVRMVNSILKDETARVRRSARVAIALSAVAVLAAIAVSALFATGVLLPGDDAPTVSDVVEEVRPSTVLVIAKVDGQRQGNGTGWVLDSDKA